jgi:uncharacterized OB-fold protein
MLNPTRAPRQAVVRLRCRKCLRTFVPTFAVSDYCMTCALEAKNAARPPVVRS